MIEFLDVKPLAGVREKRPLPRHLIAVSYTAALGLGAGIAVFFGQSDFIVWVLGCFFGGSIATFAGHLAERFGR